MTTSSVEFKKLLSLKISDPGYVLDGALADVIRRIWSPNQMLCSWIIVFKESLNLSSNGICLLAMAIERYILVCRSTDADNLLTSQRHRLLCVISTTLIVVGIVFNCFRLVHVEIYTAYFFNTGYNETIAALMGAMGYLLFFITPAIFCCALNIKVAVALKNMISNQERNQQLTRALAVSTACWLLTWIPNVCIEVYALNQFDGFYGRKYEVLQDVSRDFCMIFSVMNPIIFTILIRHLQGPINWFCRRTPNS